MPKLHHTFELTDAEIKKLKDIIHKGAKETAKTIMHAHILLLSNDSELNDKKKTNKEIAELFDISPTTVNQVRKTYSTQGIDAALQRKTRITPSLASKITGDFEAQVLAMAVGPPPKGRARWTLRLLSEHAMEKKYIVKISHTAIGDMLNTNQVKPHLSTYWCTPKEHNAEFILHMEDVLNVYSIPYNPDIPVICMDEKPKQLLDEVYARVDSKPAVIGPDDEILKEGKPKRVDSEYIRIGTSCIFIFTEPLGGWRRVVARESRKKDDYAVLMRELREVFFPKAYKIRIISDNLNIHNKATFYEAFPAKVAFELAQIYEFHHTPKHGSWLNIAESELASLSTQCLGNFRIKSVIELNELISAWECDRNTRQIGVNWQFTTEDARLKLKRLYPTPIFSE
jgi:transposase